MEIPEREGEQKHIHTVSEITRNIKLLLSDHFSDIWIRGEISNFRMAASGHMYFSLKDESSLIKAVLFKRYQNGIRFEMQDGLDVVVHGNISVFERRGDYQIIVDLLEPEGIGALKLAFEQLKEKLFKEGIFDERHKKEIPPFPETIGVITSPSGAALRDILNITQRRYRGVGIIIYPTLVQGEGAAEEIVAAIRKANQRREVDVLIVGRGGGSIEDLWCFNEESVARAIYDSDIPIISAVGHEIDYTIADFVADLRAPTPSAAAELVVKSKDELMRRHEDLIERLLASADRFLERNREKASLYTVEIMEQRLKTLLNEKNMILDDVTKSLHSGMEGILLKRKGRLEKAVGQLDALSPLGILSRGFAIVKKLPENRAVFSVNELSKGDALATRLTDGSVYSTVSGIDRNQ